MDNSQQAFLASDIQKSADRQDKRLSELSRYVEKENTSFYAFK